ncbi:MAG: LPS export ABC transporter periplasmic protein LptC [Flavobacteriales bacterium]|nr:LPS export ABC transporter periplasmic protein LptC [Flavobacteriales bacterium]
MAGIFFSCQESDPVAELISEENLPFQTTYNGEYVFTEDTKIRNVLQAGKMEHFTKDSSYIKITDGLKLEIYNRAEVKEAVLTSKNGWYDQNANVMSALDSVVFNNMEGEMMFTEELIWQEDSGLIYSDKPVMIVRIQDTIWGDGMNSNENFSNYSIINPRGSIFVEDPEEDEP